MEHVGMTENNTYISLSTEHQDHTSVLPAEILATVFDLAYGGARRTSKKLVPCAVCSRWRGIAWYYRLLWKDFKFPLGAPYKQIDRLFELHAQNAGDMPLFVEVQHCSSNDVFNRLYECIFGKYSSRIASLELRGIGQSTWEIIQSISASSPFPHLRTLKLWTDPPAGGENELSEWCSHFPNVRNLWFGNPFFAVHDVFHMEHITSLSFTEIHPDTAVYLLSRSTNLVTFIADYVDSSEDKPDYLPNPVLSRDVVLPHLHNFTWFDRTYGSVPETTPVHHLRLPAVRHLHWHWREYGITTGCWASWQRCFRSMKNLETLRLEMEAEGEYYVPRILPIFARLPLRQLSIGVCCMPRWNWEECIDYLDLDINPKRPLFPALETLKFTMITGWGPGYTSENLVVWNPIINMLASRRKPGLPEGHAPLQYFHIDSEWFVHCSSWRCVDSSWRSQHYLSLREIFKNRLVYNGKDIDLIIAECQDAREEKDGELLLLSLKDF
ncbi:hypothetical protein D9756_010096 [Leucocoprinus leucothites]|uniref:F-box domain-containing protein n=1 Tax=Leucocoprinus leucothites TaxID=201217 RepID=A0A8H5CR47_9AGAR|nr:hypothetical protein D9756_010096 [Leucoagaricus leucothites]